MLQKRLITLKFPLNKNVSFFDLYLTLSWKTSFSLVLNVGHQFLGIVIFALYVYNCWNYVIKEGEYICMEIMTLKFKDFAHTFTALICTFRREIVNQLLCGNAHMNFIQLNPISVFISIQEYKLYKNIYSSYISIMNKNLFKK